MTQGQKLMDLRNNAGLDNRAKMIGNGATR